MTEPAGTEDTGWRGSAEVWRDAAYAALVENGVDAVKIQPLAAGLNLSRTSFYWFYKDRQALLSALLALWEETTTAPLIAATRAYADTRTEAMLTVIAVFLSPRTFDSRLECAVRSWALQDADVHARLRAADEARLDALRALLTRWDHEAEDADIRARTIYLTQVGYISMQVVEPLEDRLRRFPGYVEVYTGQRPLPREIARLRAGLGLPPTD